MIGRQLLCTPCGMVPSSIFTSRGSIPSSASTAWVLPRWACRSKRQLPKAHWNTIFFTALRNTSSTGRARHETWGEWSCIHQTPGRAFTGRQFSSIEPRGAWHGECSARIDANAAIRGKNMFCNRLYARAFGRQSRKTCKVYSIESLHYLLPPRSGKLQAQFTDRDPIDADLHENVRTAPRLAVEAIFDRVARRNRAAYRIGLRV